MKTATALVLMTLISIVMDMAWALSSPRRLQKPGACPLLTPNTGGTCHERCTGDDSCSGEMKCCSDGCGHVCKPPVFKESSVVSLVRIVDDKSVPEHLVSLENKCVQGEAII
ncbi:WAP four-disulfide core domain protein 18-like [Peromyscus leucopus]|uniref:WAP four-disulfide core domain protein 18-like n=1 Tax=Peromyscus leucopus TaxID=10041 RepID=UPI001885772D|nr:WAP four-disulfide core domain protein 18-like [Peromyscus leucopus]